MFPVIYRPNVAVILQNEEGEIFVAERVGMKGAWQFPQGGVDEGEDDETAMLREVEEEIGVKPHLLKIEKKLGGYRYLFPKDRLKYGIYGGQEQTYFLCTFLGKDKDVNIKQKHQEFSQWQWIQPQKFKKNWVPEFKLKVYQAVMKDFFDVQI